MMKFPFKELWAWSWAFLRRKEFEFYKSHPDSYERMMIFFGRKDVADAVASLAARECRDAEPPKVILDTACGTGLITVAIARQFPSSHVIGADISQPSLDFAEETKKERIEWVCEDFEVLEGIEDRTVDLYIMAAAYRHIKDRQVFYNQIARVLSDRGVAIIPKMDMWWFQALGARKLAESAGLNCSVKRLNVRNWSVRPFVNRALVMRKHKKF